MPEEKSPFEKKNPKLNERLPLIGIILPERFPHPYKYSWGISYEYLSGLPEPTKFTLYYLRKCLKLYVSKIRNLSQDLLLTVNVSSSGFVSTLTSIVSLQDPLQCLESLQGAQWWVPLLYEKKGKLAKMTTHCHPLSLAVTRCHLLSIVVPLVVTSCATSCHSLSLVVIRCLSLQHSLSLVVTRCNSMYRSSVFL